MWRAVHPSTPHADSVAYVGKGTEHRIAFLYKHNDQGLCEDDIIAHNSQKTIDFMLCLGVP